MHDIHARPAACGQHVHARLGAGTAPRTNRFTPMLCPARLAITRRTVAKKLRTAKQRFQYSLQSMCSGVVPKQLVERDAPRGSTLISYHQARVSGGQVLRDKACGLLGSRRRLANCHMVCTAYCCTARGMQLRA